jgi:cob(I)alamin adenosyltransferase
MYTGHNDRPEGKIFVFTGNGKGKTTTAVGHCVRAKSRGLAVLFAQFMKNIKGGETELLRQVDIDVIRFESVLSPHFHPDLDRERNRAETIKALESLKPLMERYDLVVLDEFNCLLLENIISSEEAVAFLKSKPPHPDLIITGRGATEPVIELADLVTWLEDVKHPSANGTPARAGIDY